MCVCVCVCTCLCMHVLCMFTCLYCQLPVLLANAACDVSVMPQPCLGSLTADLRELLLWQLRTYKQSLMYSCCVVCIPVADLLSLSFCCHDVERVQASESHPMDCGHCHRKNEVSVCRKIVAVARTFLCCTSHVRVAEPPDLVVSFTNGWAALQNVGVATSPPCTAIVSCFLHAWLHALFTVA